MPLLAGNLAIDPAIAGNLRGLTEVDLQIQSDLNRASGYLSAPQLTDLQRQAEWRLSQASLRINPAAMAALVIGVTVELRSIAQLSGASILFSVSLTLREPALLPRAGDLPVPAGSGRYVDVWRHKGGAGIIIPEWPVDPGPTIIVGEALKQVDEFIAAWRRDAGVVSLPWLYNQAAPPMFAVAPVVASPAVVAAPVVASGGVVAAGSVMAPVPGPLVGLAAAQPPTQITLEQTVDKNIASFCNNSYHDEDVNHCAHFVAHVLRLQVGMTCRQITGGTNEGASIRVHELFANCSQAGTWDQLPPAITWGLIFITNPLNVDLTTKTMANVPKKHVGIFFGPNRTVYQYKNALNKVVRQTPQEFAAHYAAPDDGLFWGTI